MGTRTPIRADHDEAAPEGSASVGFPRTRPNGDRTVAGRGDGDRFANALGWFSIGLGVAEIVGIEPDAEDAAEAARAYDRVLAVPLEEISEEFPGRFDAILFKW